MDNTEKEGIKLLMDAADKLGWGIIIHTEEDTDQDSAVMGISVGAEDFLEELSEVLDGHFGEKEPTTPEGDLN